MLNMDTKMLILVINPGGLSTKLAVYDGEQQLHSASIEHTTDELKRYATIIEQLPFRMEVVERFLQQSGVKPEELSAVSGRGCPFQPLRSGVFAVNEAMVSDILEGRLQLQHASLLGPLMADSFRKAHNIPAFVVDPVSVDEMTDYARLSGLKGMDRRSLSHALNTKYVARKVCRTLKCSYEDVNMVVAHLGSGLSITAHTRGRMVDVSEGMNAGPFSPQRSGQLPVLDLANLCFSGEYGKKDVQRMIMKEGGMYSYLGTDNGREVVARATSGDAEADVVLEAMCYQIAKEIGAMAVAAGMPLKVIAITGGLAHSRVITKRIIDRVRELAPIEILPGEFESEALAEGARRVLNEDIAALEYPAPPEIHVHF